MRTGHWASVLVLAASATTVGQACLAQDSQNSSQTDAVAAAARHARDEKTSHGRTTTVFTNDNLPANGSISVVGQPGAPNTSNSSSAPSPSGSTSAQPAGDTVPASATSADSKKAVAATAALAAAKEKFASTKKDLDILQRKFSLDQQTFVSNPNHASDIAGQDALDAEQALINGKQEDVAAAQKEVDRLTALAPPSADASSTIPGSGSTDKSANSL